MKTVFAHRGMSSLAPENTLSAFALCRENGIKWLECDVDILADGTVVLSHDDTLERCTNRCGSLYDLTEADLDSIDAGSWFSDDYDGEKIPTFEQFISLVNDHELNINVEIKSCTSGWENTLRLIDGVVKGLESLNPERELIISSFNHLALAEFKKRRPETRIACLFENANLWDDWQSILQACGAEFIHPEDKGLTKDRVKMMKDAGYGINVYTVNDLARANQLFNWGVDGVFTDVAQKFPRKYKQDF
ncbi:glycerophosphoryl diester phosphodiesterase [Parasalinivibrio latis]|uniref:glycerophosphoryl diester phosphodiesterase n=1 Tax=Parasalinivibrio latis TaxID=2952610 RepID=UPI0030DFBCB9